MERNHYKSARYSLLLIIALTVVNCVLWFTESQTYFLFCAAMPYAIVQFGSLLFVGTASYPILIGSILLAAAILGVYLALFFLSKNRKGAMLAAAILFAVDTVMMLALFFDASMIIDLVIHAFILFELFNALRHFPQPEGDGMVILPGDEEAVQNAEEATLPVEDEEVTPPAEEL